MPEIQRLNLSSFKEVLQLPKNAPLAFSLALKMQEILADNSALVSRASKRLDFLVYEFKASNASRDDHLETISFLNDFFFKEKNFQFLEDSLDPEDVFPGRVLEKRAGCGLALTLIYREILQRAGVGTAEFVNFPGHSLVKVLYRHQLLFLDPTDCGRLLKVADLQYKLSQKYGRNTLLNGSLLETPSDTEFVSRLLTKLKSVYVNQRDWRRLLACLDFLVLLHPTGMTEYKERGLLLYQLGFLEEAQMDLHHFIVKSRPSPEIEKLRKLVTHLGDPPMTTL